MTCTLLCARHCFERNVSQVWQRPSRVNKVLRIGQQGSLHQSTANKAADLAGHLYSGAAVCCGAPAGVRRHRRPGGAWHSEGSGRIPARTHRAAPLWWLHGIWPRRSGARSTGPGVFIGNTHCIPTCETNGSFMRKCSPVHVWDSEWPKGGTGLYGGIHCHLLISQDDEGACLRREV